MTNDSSQGKDSELYKRLSDWHLYRLRDLYNSAIASNSENADIRASALLKHLAIEFPIDGVAPTDPRSRGMVTSFFKNNEPSDFWTNPSCVTNEARVIIILRLVTGVHKISIEPRNIEYWDWFSDNFQDFMLDPYTR